jgi:hypothetical protein
MNSTHRIAPRYGQRRGLGVSGIAMVTSWTRHPLPYAASASLLLAAIRHPARIDTCRTAETRRSTERAGNRIVGKQTRFASQTFAGQPPIGVTNQQTRAVRSSRDGGKQSNLLRLCAGRQSPVPFGVSLGCPFDRDVVRNLRVWCVAVPRNQKISCYQHRPATNQEHPSQCECMPPPSARSGAADKVLGTGASKRSRSVECLTECRSSLALEERDFLKVPNLCWA